MGKHLFCVRMTCKGHDPLPEGAFATSTKTVHVVAEDAEQAIGLCRELFGKQVRWHRTNSTPPYKRDCGFVPATGWRIDCCTRHQSVNGVALTADDKTAMVPFGEPE